jgi:GT2 family glycosyltransferase
MFDQQPLCSIIIPNWNGADYLPVCLDALRRQTYPRLEILIVDNASTDRSLVLLAQDYPEVRVIQLDDNYGLTGVCNRGAEASRGDVLIMLNNDTEAEPGWLAALVETLVEHPEAGSAASKMLLFDRRDTLHTAGDHYGMDGIPRNRGVWEPDEGQYDQAVEVFSGCGGAVAYRREAWDAVGGFDEEFFMYCEDVDLGWRLQLAGYRAVFDTGRNTIWVLAKDVPGRLLRRHWWRIVKAQTRIAWEALRAWRGEAARARLRGQLAGVLSLPRILRKRRAVQSSKQVDDEYLIGLLVE